MNKHWDLKGKNALITGGTKGIGLAILKQFLSLGANVLFTSRNSKDIETITSQFHQYKSQIRGLKSDVMDSQDRVQLVEWINDTWGELHILVNNAGINIRRNAVDYSSEELMKVMNVNLLGLFELTRSLFIPLSKSKNSAVVNVASVAATVDVNSGAPYAMSKAGMLQLSRSLATEWASYGIRVNTVSPWYTKTPLTEGVLSDSQKNEKIIRRTPMARVAEPEEMASVVSFLAMDHASYITGQNINVDGGMLAMGLYN